MRYAHSGLAVAACVIAVLAIGGCGPSDDTTSDQPAGASGDVSGQEEARPQEMPPTPPPIQTDVTELGVGHILIQYAGAQRAPAEVTRSKEEAQTLATELSKRIKAGEDFGKLAAEYSDDTQSGPRGGTLGVFHPQQLVPEFARAALALEEGQVSEPVQTVFGFHLIQRQKIEKVGARHILIMHQESLRKPPTVTRTKEEARELVQSLHDRIVAGEDFATLAAEYTDDPSTKDRGGDLGTFSRGRMVPEFEHAAFSLDVGQTSDVIETDYGFHIIQRTE